MRLPIVRKCLPFLALGGTPVYVLDVITENGAFRKKLDVKIPIHIHDLIQKSELVPVNRKTPEGNPLQTTTIGETVYAYRLLEKNGLGKQYPDLLTRSIEEGRQILDVAFEMVKFVKALEGA